MYYMPTGEDTEVEVEAPKLLLIPTGFVDWMPVEVRTLWDFHKKIMKKISKTGENSTPTGMGMSLN